jgi:glycosyltransferase involved in cell wall biosynthesis
VKVVFLVRSLKLGGAERQLVALAKGLHKRGYQIIVVVFYQNGILERDLYEAGIPVHALNKRGRWDVVGFYLNLARFIKQERPDILHGYLGMPNILSVLLKTFSPGTLMVWGVRASNLNLSQYDWVNRISDMIEAKLARYADLIIVNSYAGFRDAQSKGFPAKKMLVIPNGIDTYRFRPDRESRHRTRTLWHVPADRILIGSVARLDPMKDHPTFLKAAALLVHERKDVCFACVGDGPAEYSQKLVTLGKELGLEEQLIWTGEIEDTSAIYNALDILTSSSSFGEGFSNVIGEAMSCGVPCVVTDCGDAALLVGEAGIVVPPGDPERLAAAWHEILQKNEMDYRFMCHYSRQRILTNFNLGHLHARTSQALEQLLGSEGAGLANC